MCQGRFRLDIRENFFMERVVQPRAEVKSPDLTDVWMWYLGTWVVLAVLGEYLDSMISEVFSNLNDSVIL